MGFGTFAFLGVVMALAGVRVVKQIYDHRRELFDETFTDQDRHLITMLAFYILIPISVILHELGHALAVLAFHGTITGYGYYIFAGYVSYEGYFTPAQQSLVAFAGPIVNVILGLGAFAILVGAGRRFRAPINELLLQFSVLSIANILIFYPLLDLATNLDGDFRQMYFDGPRGLAIAIFAGHAGILAGAYLGSKNSRFGRYLGQLTGMPQGVGRGLMGGFQLGARSGSGRAMRPFPSSKEERALEDVAKRVARGWPDPVDLEFGRNGATAVQVLKWLSNGHSRVALMAVTPERGVVLSGLVSSDLQPEAEFPWRKLYRRWQEWPTSEDLTISLRMAMEQIDGVVLARNTGPEAGAQAPQPA